MRRLAPVCLGALLSTALFAGVAPGTSPEAAGVAVAPTVRTRTPPAPAPAPAAARSEAAPQPFPGDAADALQVVSVVAGRRATTAAVTFWQRAAVGAAWHPAAPAATAHLGATGVTAHPREGLSATPLGSYTLTRAFGRDANPGHRVTALDYRRLRPGDGWSTAPGRRYNTLARTGEMYLGRDGWMRAAILIDYNVEHPKQRAGSGFFIHAWTFGTTDGCVGLPLRVVQRMLSWLQPSARPRVVIAVSGAPGATGGGHPS